MTRDKSKNDEQTTTPERFRESVKDNIRQPTGDQVRKNEQEVVNTKPAPDERPDQSNKKK